MSLSNSDRQRRYRARNRGNARINTNISFEAGQDLKRLARHWGLSQREALERLVQEAAGAVVAGFESAPTHQEHQEQLNTWCAPLD